MVELILFVALGVGILVAFEIRARKQAKEAEGQKGREAEGQIREAVSDGCCGAHLVCERETLLQTNAEIVYYDDEELDELAGILPEEYTDKQYNAIAEVFHTLQEKDVPGWCRSLQLRHIELPLDIREEALLIVRERRAWNRQADVNGKA